MQNDSVGGSEQASVDPQAQAFATRLAKLLKLEPVAVSSSSISEAELRLMEQRSGGSERPIGTQYKVEFEGLSLLSARFKTNGQAFRFAAATMGARHDAWGALDDTSPLTPSSDFLVGELVAQRSKEVLLAWGPALADLNRLQQTVEVAWSERASKNPFVAKAVFHRDYAAVFVDKPHGHVYEEMQLTLQRAKGVEDPSLVWVTPDRQLRFKFASGYCGEVSSDEGGGRYWVARKGSDQQAAEGTLALINGGEPRGRGGISDAIQGE